MLNLDEIPKAKVDSEEEAEALFAELLLVKAGENEVGARWENLGREAVGGSVISVAGVTDYQGWMTILSAVNSENGRYAVLSWSYGSCGGCDPFEGYDEAEVVKMMADHIFYTDSAYDAWLKFEDQQYW